MIEEKIEKIIKNAFKTEFGLKLSDLNIQYPEPQFGDFAVSCHKYARELKMSPQAIAEKLSGSIKDELVKKAEAVSGYLNIFVDSGVFSKNVLTEIIEKGGNYGESKQYKQKVVLEYSSPNTNKPLHLGHIRNNVLGMSFSRILESQGAEVVKTQIINDKGIHIMKSLVAYQKLGKNETPQSAGEKGDHFVGRFYVAFDEETMMDDAKEALRKWEAGDKEICGLWKKMNNWVYEGYEVTYKKLGSEFDKNYYESDTYLPGKEVVELGLKKGVFYKEEDGSVGVDLGNAGLDKKIVQRSDGTSLYITQDLGLAVKREKEFKCDSIVYVVGHEQEYHFKVLFEVLKRLGYKWAGNLRHLSYGLVFLPEGKMKSREGKVVDADDIIEQVQDLAASEIKKRFPDITEQELAERSRMIGMGALKFMLLRITPSQSVYFNPREAVEFEGATGPYIQYAHARISGILESQPVLSVDKIDFNLLDSQEEKQVILALARYPYVLAQSAESYNPGILCNYLMDLARRFNTFYHKRHVLRAENEETKLARLGLVASVQIVLRSGLGILGIDAPDKM